MLPNLRRLFHTYVRYRTERLMKLVYLRIGSSKQILKFYEDELHAIINVDRQQKGDSKMKSYAKLFILSATVVGMTTIVGCNKPQEVTDTTKPSTSVKTEISDSDVTMKVKTALHSDEMVKSFDIAVVTTKGDVRLTGTVDSQDQLDYIDKLVRSIEGVHSLHDELTIKK